MPVDVAMPCFRICAWCSPSLCASRDLQRVPLLPRFVCCFLLSERLHLRSAGAIGMMGCFFEASKCALSAMAALAKIRWAETKQKQFLESPFFTELVAGC